MTQASASVSGTESAASERHDTAFAVEGMFCGGCAATVERALRRLPGVEDVSVSFLSDAAWIRHDPARIGAAQLSERLDALGYASRTLDAGPGASAMSRGGDDAFLRALRVRLAVAVGFGMWVMLATVARYFTELPSPAYAGWLALASGVLSLPVLLVSGAPFWRLGWRGLRARVPGMESLILLATLATLAASGLSLAHGGSEVWFEVPVMLIAYQLIARLGDVSARRRAADAMRGLLDLSPGTARRIEGGVSVAVTESALRIGDLLEWRAGERLAADGVVDTGHASVDNALLTGESLPIPVGPGDAVLAGTVNVDGLVRVRVASARGERTLDRLAASVGRALNARSDLMRFIDRVAGALVPLILAAAAIAFVLGWLATGELGSALQRALATLVVSCPCALSLAVPLVVAIAAARAAREGILLRDPSVLEQAHRIDTIVFDKTGTLTQGRPTVVAIVPVGGATEHDVMRLAALAGAGSEHPLARAIEKAAAARGIEVSRETFVERHERAGAGIRLRTTDDRSVLVGSSAWLGDHGVEVPPADDSSAWSCVAVACDGQLVGTIGLSDAIRPDAPPLLDALRRRGLRPILASGDSPGAVRALAETLDLEWHAQLLPSDKCALIGTLQDAGQHVAFVGDGLNDALALAKADLGIATGTASDLARSAAGVSVLNGGLQRVDAALRLAACAARALRRNLVLAIGFNALLIPLAVLGHVNPLLAVGVMIASSLAVALCVLPVGMGREQTPDPRVR